MTQTPLEPGTPGPLNILIVDDSAMMRAVIKRAAAMTGLPLGAVLEAANGREALRLLETTPIHAVFTDINMPVMNGLDLLREIAARPQLADVLRVIISTDGSTTRRAEAEQLRVSLYVEKPFRPEVMKDVLSELVARRPPVG